MTLAMGDIPKLDVGGFPFRSGDDAARIRVLVAALDPRPESVDALLDVLDGALVFAAKYSAAAKEVEAYDRLVKAFSPLEVEEFRAMHERHIERRNDETGQRYVRRAPRPNLFAPAGPWGSQDAPSSSAVPASADATPLLTDLATASVRAAAELRALRADLDQQVHAVWLRAVHDAAALLVRAGKAKVTW